MVNILARIVDSERNFNGSADPMMTADRGFIQILGPDFGFCLFGSSDRGSQRPPGKCYFLTTRLRLILFYCLTGWFFRLQKGKILLVFRVDSFGSVFH